MWIRVESFAPDSTTPTTTLNVWTDRLEDGSPLVAVGRKAGDVIFPTDKSVSRQHCEIKCLKQQQEGRKEVERKAIEANPFGCTLVVANHGKSGTFIAELPLPQDLLVGSAPDMADSDDDATDDEGVISQRQTQQKSQLASLGDGTLAPEALLLSASTKELWAQHIHAVKLVKVDMNESRVLDFSEPRSIMLQVGSQGSSIKISWIPLRIVFSRLPKELESIKKDLSKIGATEDSVITPDTTHLVSPEATVSAKPLTACCRGLPIVTPSYLQALMNHAKPEDPVPPLSDFLSPFDQRLILIKEKGANSQLMRGYTVFFLDNIDDVEALVHFSGGTSIALYDLQNETDRLAKVKACMLDTPNHVFLVMVSKKRLYNKLLKIDGMYSFKPEAWATSIYSQNPQLKGVGGTVIPTPSRIEKPSSTATSNIIKPAASQNDLVDDDSETDDEMSPSIMTQKSNLQTQEDVVSTESVERNSRRSRKGATGSPEKAVTVKKRAAMPSSPPEGQIDSSMTELDAPARKRRKRAEFEDPILQGSEGSRSTRAEASVMVAENDDHLGESLEHEDSPRFPLDLDEPPIHENEGFQKNRTSHTKNVQSDAAVRSRESLGGVDANGWYISAPKTDSTRRAWRQKASKRFAETDGDYFQPAAGSKEVAAVVSPSEVAPTQSHAAQSVRRRKSNGVDFRSFRKNIVPRKIDDSETIPMIVVQAREDAVQQELEEEQRQLMIQQRVADELFRDLGSSQPRRKRRD
jgi:FHA domain